MSDMSVKVSPNAPVFARRVNNGPTQSTAALVDGYAGPTASQSSPAQKGSSLLSKVATAGAWSALAIPPAIGVGKQILGSAATAAATKAVAGLGAMALLKGVAITVGCGLAGAVGLTAVGLALASLVMPKYTEAWQTVGLGIALVGTLLGGGIGLVLGHGLGF